MSFLQNVNKYGPVSCNELYNTNAAVMNLRMISLAAAVLVMPSWSLGCISSACTPAPYEPSRRNPIPRPTFLVTPGVSHATFSPQWDNSPALCGTQPSGPRKKNKINTPAVSAAPKSSLQLAHARLPNRNTQRTRRCGGGAYNLIKQLPHPHAPPQLHRRRNTRYQGS
jgi:hypothetical protein